MTKERQRIAIAEACGWRFYPQSQMDKSDPDYEQRKARAVMVWVRPGNDDWQHEQIPDFLHDLNAMAEAEKALPKDLRNRYINLLSDITAREEQDAVDADFAWCCAAAAQRAEAFLRTIGKWEVQP